MFNNEGLSLSDIAAATGNGRNGNDGFGFGGGIWVLIILFALFGGWGNNGARNGNNNGGGNTVVVPVPSYGACSLGGGWGSYDAASMQRGFDTQSIIQKLDGLNNGVCSLGYDQLAQMNGINSNIQQAQFGLQQAINGVGVAAMQDTNALSRQLSDCCCENRQGQAQIRWDMSQLGCNLQNTMNQNTQAVMQNDNANFRQLNDLIRDGFCNLKMEQKDQQIAQLTAMLNKCDAANLAQSTAQQVVQQISPRAIPAYPASNPNYVGNWAPQVLSGGCYNNGCGCNSCCGNAA